MIPLFDLHCDTFLEIYKNKYRINDSPTHVSLEKTKEFSPYVQVGAIWSDFRFSDEECFVQYTRVIDYLKTQNIHLCVNSSLFRPVSFVLAVEDARLLNGDLSRLDILHSDGVRFLTLNWKGDSIIGGGWDTDNPLTVFGKNVVTRCAELGIIIDISHSSQNVQNEVIKMGRKLNFSPIASHSCSFYVNPHKRNLTDNIFYDLMELGGLVGISLVPEHLSQSHDYCDLYKIIKHIDHFLEVGGENNVSLGCDLDGVESLPHGISSIADLSKLHKLVCLEFGEKICNKLFFYNAYNFATKNLK